MELMLIEIVLWAGLLFFIWALKDGLGRVENDIESLGLLSKSKNGGMRTGPIRYYRPDKVSEVIGSYLGVNIHRYATIDGRQYEFSHVCPPGYDGFIAFDERCIAPGLVYKECEARAN